MATTDHNKILGALLLAISFQSAWALNPEQVFAIASPSVVMVFAGDKQDKPRSQGSGVVVSQERVITNCHVIYKKGKPYQAIAVKREQQVWPAHFITGNDTYDTCLLTVPSLPTSPVVIADSTTLRVGQRVYAIGAPSGLELTLSEGLLSGLRITRGSKVIQTSAAISPGSSGGGLFDENGYLIGITSFQIGSGTGLNFAYFSDPILSLVKTSRSVNASIISREAMSDSVRAGLGLEDGDKPPRRASFRDPQEQSQWLAAMLPRIGEKIPDDARRRELLLTVHYEATRSGLDSQLVLAVIDLVSSFTAAKESKESAQGYMQVHPGWVPLVGQVTDNLSYLRTNLRYGCTILRHYLDLEQGDLYLALIRYERAMLEGPGYEWRGAEKSDFPNRVRMLWHTRWLYPRSN